MTLPISDQTLLECLYRADKFLDGFENKIAGPLQVTSNDRTLNIFWDHVMALSYDKSEGEICRRLRARCNCIPSALDKALKRLRELMVLDDLAAL